MRYSLWWKKFQKEQMTAEGYTEFVEFFNK